MNYTQVVFKILEDEKGFDVNHYVALGYCRNTIKNYQRGKTSIPLNELGSLMSAINYSTVTMLEKVAEYERKRVTESA